MDIRTLDRRALEATGRVLAHVPEDRLDARTPCAEWNLTTLLVHMAGNNNGFAEAAEGRPADPAVWEGRNLGQDVIGEYQKSADRVRSAFAEDGVLERTFTVHGFGSYPAHDAIGMHFIDYLVHGWDVAASAGIEYHLDDELCLAVLEMGATWPAGSPRIWGPGAPFGHPVVVPEDASPAKRMLGFLGRSPQWPA
jgi:uncharacterized protein (TIGR03086 family)